MKWNDDEDDYTDGRAWIRCGCVSIVIRIGGELRTGVVGGRKVERELYGAAKCVLPITLKYQFAAVVRHCPKCVRNILEMRVVGLYLGAAIDKRIQYIYIGKGIYIAWYTPKDIQLLTHPLCSPHNENPDSLSASTQKSRTKLKCIRPIQVMNSLIYSSMCVCVLPTRSDLSLSLCLSSPIIINWKATIVVYDLAIDSIRHLSTFLSSYRATAPHRTPSSDKDLHKMQFSDIESIRRTS